MEKENEPDYFAWMNFDGRFDKSLTRMQSFESYEVALDVMEGAASDKYRDILFNIESIYYIEKSEDGENWSYAFPNLEVDIENLVGM